MSAPSPLSVKKENQKLKIQILETRRANLGMLKGKEKREITAEINELYREMPGLNDIKNEEQERRNQKQPVLDEIHKAMADLKKQDAELQAKITEIDNELTKDR